MRRMPPNKVRNTDKTTIAPRAVAFAVGTVSSASELSPARCLSPGQSRSTVEKHRYKNIALLTLACSQASHTPQIEQNLSGLLNLIPEQTDELLQRVDQPLEEVRHESVLRIGTRAVCRMSQRLHLSRTITLTTLQLTMTSIHSTTCSTPHGHSSTNPAAPFARICPFTSRRPARLPAANTCCVTTTATATRTARPGTFRRRLPCLSMQQEMERVYFRSQDPML